jgi:hypothetical protein
MTNTVSAPRVPGSEHIPFKPFNPHNKTPTVTRADGSVVEWKSPMREKLYQCFVEDVDRGHIPIGPKVGMAIADSFRSATQLAIKSGKITGWSNPHVKPV